MYAVGSKVVHPVHGAATIASIEEKSFGDTSQTYYMLNCIAAPRDMTLMVPSGALRRPALVDGRRRSPSHLIRLAADLRCRRPLPTTSTTSGTATWKLSRVRLPLS